MKQSKELTLPNLAEGRLGPAMQKLTELQRNFVLAMLVTGETKFGRLAALAGYQGNENTLRVCGHGLAHNPRVLAAIEEESRSRIKSSAIIATNKLVEIATNDQRKDQLKAIEMVLNRAGLHAITESRSVNLNVQADGTQLSRLKTAFEKLGVDPNTVLGKMGMVVDAEFTVIKEITPVEGNPAAEPEVPHPEDETPEGEEQW